MIVNLFLSISLLLAIAFSLWSLNDVAEQLGKPSDGFLRILQALISMGMLVVSGAALMEIWR
jgi:DNA-binding IclR family transcriptional regulator